MRAQKVADLVIVSGQQLHGWFDDELTLVPEHSPPLSSLDEFNYSGFKHARRQLGAILSMPVSGCPQASYSCPLMTWAN